MAKQLPKKIVFFGLGSIAKKHIKLIQNGHPEFSLYAFRDHKKKREASLLKEIYSWEEIDKLKPDIAFITNPTFLHIQTAINCAKRGMTLFIEKPIGVDDKNLNILIEIVEKKNLATYVGYNLRFHPIIEAIKEYLKEYSFLHMRVFTTSYLPNWRTTRNHLETYSAKSKEGGGVILDLSHEVDYVSYLLNGVKHIKGQFGRRSKKITVDAEDYADLLLETECGPVNIHINFLSQVRQREIWIDFEEISIKADLIGSTINEYRNEKIVNEKCFDCGEDISYIRQLNYFFSNTDNSRMMNSLFEAIDVFKKLLDFKRGRDR
jgi:predicted dehydrogenase